MTSISSSTVTHTATTAVTTPAHRREEYTIAEIVLKFFDEKAKDIAKALGYGTFWLGEAIPNLPPQVKSFSTTMGDFKNFVSATEVPKKAVELSAALSKLWTTLSDGAAVQSVKDNGLWASITSYANGVWAPNAPVADSAQAVGSAVRKTFEKTTGLVNATVDGIDFAHRFIPIEGTVMTWLKGLNFAATLGGSGSAALEQVQGLAENHADTHKRNLHMIKIAQFTSYIVLGAIGLASIITATAIVPWMMVACLTSGLFFTTASYVYEKVYDPEHKGKNLDPEAVIANVLASRP